ncbi:hypothetical protein SLS60_011756 [Paraconiothyrium brasiliense]|uniref:Allantoate permease n=1 Tax=Paraconiothyrium brasiliense TaxID=300254 RepID=A0ABR3QHX6_9PLEO
MEKGPESSVDHSAGGGTRQPPSDAKANADTGIIAGEQHIEHQVTEKDVDDTSIFYTLNASKFGPLTPELERKVTRKNFWFLLCQTWWIAFCIHLDKSTLSQASTMGIFKDVKMTKKQYNDLFVVFYTGYLVALWPGAWLSQRVGQKHFITGSLFLWAFLLAMHPLVKTGEQMMGLRFLLGMTESQIVPSTTVVHQAFFPPLKSPWVQLLWWASGSLANVLLTMVAYKLIVSDSSGALVGGLSSWKWLHIVCVIITFAVFVPLLVWLPNSPVDAKWLTTEEKVHTISIIRREKAGISNSTFKWSQVREAFTDVKSWLFISKLAAPWDNKIALVVGTQISTFKPSYLLGLSWAGTTVTGYTKKLYVMASCIVAASVANMISPEFWEDKYKPRYRLPWAFMTAFWFISPGMCLLIRWYLVRENTKRRQLVEQDRSDHKDEVLNTGSQIFAIEDEDLDQTDRENLKFVYPL